MNNKIIKDVITRTKGQLYLGVVGSVRSGKSTFIRRFMETKVIPYLKDDHLIKKIEDELPQSASGKKVMTVEPKFIPSEQMMLSFDNDLSVNLRLVDCVGYVIPSAVGYLNEDGSSRLVKTPWFSDEIPFSTAAVVGTKKVIDFHSNIGVVITSDGSFGDFTREEYALVEKDIIEDLKASDKPFIIVLNTSKPNDDKTLKLVKELEELYQVSVISLNILEMTEEDVDEILKTALDEFKISKLELNMPKYLDYLDNNSHCKERIMGTINENTKDIVKMKDVYKFKRQLEESKMFKDVKIESLYNDDGFVDINFDIDDEYYQEIIAEIMGSKISSKEDFIKTLLEIKHQSLALDEFGTNLKDVLITKDGFVIPDKKYYILEEPKIFKQGSRYGISLKAKANILYITNIDVTSSFDPIIGDKMQTEMLLNHMVENYNEDQDLIWNSEFFGRKLQDIITDGIKVKIKKIDDNTKAKYKEGLNKLVDKSKTTLITIII